MNDTQTLLTDETEWMTEYSASKEDQKAAADMMLNPAITPIVAAGNMSAEEICHTLRKEEQ